MTTNRNKPARAPRAPAPIPSGWHGGQLIAADGAVLAEAAALRLQGGQLHVHLRAPAAHDLTRGAIVQAHARAWWIDGFENAGGRGDLRLACRAVDAGNLTNEV